MAEQDSAGFTGFGFGRLPRSQAAAEVYLLVVYRDGSLTAAAHATERGAMAAAVESLSDEWDDEEEVGGLEDAFSRAQTIVIDGGGVLEIVPSAVHGS